MKCLMIMACDGRVDNGFRFCAGVSNVLLDFETLTHTPNYLTLIDYLDHTSHLFEGPCFNGNLIMNTIHKAYELEYLTDELYKRATHYYHFHKLCGPYLRLQPKE